MELVVFTTTAIVAIVGAVAMLLSRNAVHSVLFLLVVMLLGAERSEDERDKIAWQRPLALLMTLLLFGEAIYVFISRSSAPLIAAVGSAEDFATPVKISEVLFTTYLLPFEITSVILLAAL